MGDPTDATQNPDSFPDSGSSPEGAHDGGSPVRSTRRAKRKQRRRTVRPADADARARAAAEALADEEPELEEPELGEDQVHDGAPEIEPEPEYEPRDVAEAAEDVTSAVRFALLLKALHRVKTRKVKPNLQRLEKTAKRTGDAFGKRVVRWAWLDRAALIAGTVADLFAPGIEDAIYDTIDVQAPSSQVVDVPYRLVEGPRT